MPTNKKINIVSDLTEKLAAAKSVVLTDYRGLTTPQIEELRQKIEEVGGTFMITKNTLLQLALEATGYQLPARQSPDARQPLRGTSGLGSRRLAGGPPTTYQLEGPTATLFAFQDEIAPLKALTKFGKEWELPTIKAGFLGQEFITAEKVKELAKLPGKNELLTKLVGQLQVPIYGTVNALQGNLKNLVYLLQSIKESKGGD